MYCANCGKKIPDDSRFCPECGCPVHVEEESLISRAKKGDNEAIKQIVYQYRGMVRYQARLYVKNEDDVDEIEQQVFIKAFSKTSDLTDEKKFGGWLKVIAINTSKDYVTSAFKKRSVMFTDLDDTNNDMVYDAADERIDHRPDVQMDETSRRDIILEVLDGLPETQRMVIVMHYYDNLSFKDIAEQLNIPMSTVTGRVQMAKNNIKTCVTDIQNREGITLYNLSPIAFFIWLLGLERKAPVTVMPPAVGKTVKVNKAEPAKRDKAHYGTHRRAVKAEKTVKRAAKARAGKAAVGGTAKAAGTGFLATTAGKAAIAGAIAVAAVGGGAAGVHYHNVHTSSDNQEGVGEKEDKKQSDNGKSDNQKNIITEKELVWIRNPGSLDIDDFDDLQSSRVQGTYMGRYTTVEENTGYSPTWIENTDISYQVDSYSGNGIIVKSGDLLGIDDYDGNVITEAAYSSISALHALGVYKVEKAENSETSDISYLDTDFSVKNAENGFGDGDWPTYKIFLSGNTVYELPVEEWADVITEDASQYEMKAPTIMPVINGYQSGDVNLDAPSGFCILQPGSDPTELPDGMIPTYYASALEYNVNFEKLMNSYAYNTCFVNDVIKLQDEKNKIHLWNVKTGKFISDQSFDDATFYEDGYIGVKKNGKWAFMDMNGKIVTDYLFDKVSGFYEGKVYVDYKGKPGILNLKQSIENAGIVEKENQQDNSDFSKIAGVYAFSSGRGAWGNEFTLNTDGTFNGEYSDADMGISGPNYPKGTTFYAKYNGKFKDLKKLDDNKYKITLDGGLEYANKVDTKEIKDGMLYQYGEAYGFEDTGTFTVLLKGYNQNQLNSDELFWIESVAGTESSQSSMTMQNLIINDATDETFVQIKG